MEVSWCELLLPSVMTGRSLASRSPNTDCCFVRVPEVVRELPVTSAVGDLRQPHYSSSRNFEMPSKRAPTKGRAGKAKRPEQDHYETDYTTGGESCDELEEDWIR